MVLSVAGRTITDLDISGRLVLLSTRPERVTRGVQVHAGLPVHAAAAAVCLEARDAPRRLVAFTKPPHVAMHRLFSMKRTDLSEHFVTK